MTPIDVRIAVGQIELARETDDKDSWESRLIEIWQDVLEEIATEGVNVDECRALAEAALFAVSKR